MPATPATGPFGFASAPPSTLAMLITAAVLLTGGLYLRSIHLASGNWSPAVVYPTVSALGLVTGYDLLQHFWLYQRLKT